MTNAEKFEEVFGVKPDPECCPLKCSNDNGMFCFRCTDRDWFKDEFKGDVIHEVVGV